MMKRTGLYMGNETFVQDQRNNTYSQTEVPTQHFLDGLHIGQKIGFGSAGQVYHCTLDNKRYAIKMPVELIQNSVFQINNQKIISHLPNASQPRLTESVVEAKRRFHEEADVLSLIFDAPSMRAKAGGKPWARMENLSPSEFNKIHNELKERLAHPGYHTLAKAVHFIEPIFSILMEVYDGGLVDLMRDGHMQNTGIRNMLTEDMMSAMDYLKTMTGMANADIKPDNILFRMGQPNHIEKFVMCDFGSCRHIDEPILPKHFATDLWSPHKANLPVVEAAWMPAQKMRAYALAIYELAVVALYMYSKTACHAYAMNKRPLLDAVVKTNLGLMDPSMHHQREVICIWNIIQGGPQAAEAGYAQWQALVHHQQQHPPALPGAPPPPQQPQHQQPQPPPAPVKVTPEVILLIWDELGVLYNDMMRFDPTFAASNNINTAVAEMLTHWGHFARMNADEMAYVQDNLRQRANLAPGGYYSTKTLAAISRLRTIIERVHLWLCDHKPTYRTQHAHAMEEGLRALQIYYDHLKPAAAVASLPPPPRPAQPAQGAAMAASLPPALLRPAQAHPQVHNYNAREKVAQAYA